MVMVMARGESWVLAIYSAWRAGAGHVTAPLAARVSLVALGPAVRALGGLLGPGLQAVLCRAGAMVARGGIHLYSATIVQWRMVGRQDGEK